MKVAILTGRDPAIKTDTDGGSVFVEYFIRQLNRYFKTIDFYLPLGVMGGLYSEERAQAQQGMCKGGDNVRVTYFPVAPAKTKIELSGDYFYERMERARGFVDFFSDKKLYEYDLVCILHVSNASYLAAHGLIPLEKTVLFPMMTSANYDLFSAVPEEYIKLEGETLRVMRHICSPSDDEIKKIETRFGVPAQNLFKVNRGFEEDDFPRIVRPPISLDQPVRLVCANGIRPQKDHLFLVSVAKELKRRGIPFQFHLTGNNGKSHNPLYNAYTKEFWDAVADAGLNDFFRAYNVISRSDLARLMEASQIGVYASISETFGKSALESVVTGLPTLVCDDVPAFGEFIKNNETGIIAPRKASAWADAIEHLRSDPVSYELISKNGIALRPQFTWRKVMNDLVAELKARNIIELLPPAA